MAFRPLSRTLLLRQYPRSRPRGVSDVAFQQFAAFAVVQVDDFDAVSRSQSRSARRKVRLSPTTSVPMRNCRTNPLQYQHGSEGGDHDQVAVAFLPARRGERRRSRRARWDRPAARGGCDHGSPDSPVRVKSAAPMGMPPSDHPRRASSRATANIRGSSAESDTKMPLM